MWLADWSLFNGKGCKKKKKKWKREVSNIKSNGRHCLRTITDIYVTTKLRDTTATIISSESYPLLMRSMTYSALGSNNTNLDSHFFMASFSPDEAPGML